MGGELSRSTALPTIRGGFDFAAAELAKAEGRGLAEVMVDALENKLVEADDEVYRLFLAQSIPFFNGLVADIRKEAIARRKRGAHPIVCDAFFDAGRAHLTMLYSDYLKRLAKAEERIEQALH